MTNDDPYVDFADTWPVSVPGDPQARAYGGAAHGHEWPVDDDDPPAWIELPVGVSSCLYRLVRQPRTGRPAHDYRGNYLYVPIAVPTPAVAPQECRVLPFPAGGRGG